VREVRREEVIQKPRNQVDYQVKKNNNNNNRLDGYFMIGEKENNKSNRGKTYNGFVDLTRDASPKEQYARRIHGGNESNVFMNARKPESGAFNTMQMQQEMKRKPPKTIVNPFDPTKSFDMSEFKDLSLKSKKPATNGDASKSFPKKRNQTIEIL